MGFFALGGDPKRRVPLFFVFLGWVLPAETQRGAFLFPLFSCSVCFLLGSSSGLSGACLLPPEKETFRPSLRGVRVCGVADYPATKTFFTAAGAGTRMSRDLRDPTKTVVTLLVKSNGLIAVGRTC